MKPRIVLVTGASSGIGAACALRLARAGHTVIGASRSGTAAPPIEPRVLDITDPAAIDTFLAAIAAEFGRIDAVINAAGIAVAGPLEDTPLPLLRAQLETNLLGAVYLFRAATPYLRRSAPAHLIHISSLAAHIPLPYQSLYCAAHFGMSGLCRSLQYELAPHRVHVTLVEPGSVRTGLTKNRQTATANAVYSAAAAAALSANDKDEMKGIDPAIVAAAVEKILHSNTPPGRVSVGHWHERIGLPASRFLPARWFRSIIGSHYLD